MISLLGETQHFAQASSASGPVETAVSWLHKSVSSFLPDFTQQSVKVGMEQGIVSPYLSTALNYTKPIAGTAACVVASETAYGLYETHKVNKVDKDNEYNKLLAQKAAYQSIYEQPLLGRMEISSTLASTAATNVTSAVIAGSVAAPALPAIVSGVTASLGLTLVARLIKKGVYAYKTSKLAAKISALASVRKHKKCSRKQASKMQTRRQTYHKRHGHKHRTKQRRHLKRLQ